MDRDENGEAVFSEAVLIPPRLRDAALVLGFNIRRLESGATSPRGYRVPCVEMLLRTTEGEFTFLLSRDDMSKAAHGMVEVLCDS